MKRPLLYLLILSAALAACRKDDDPIFDQSPDERLNEALSAYEAALTGSEYGWNATLTTADSAMYSFHFRFNDANRVQMFADIDTNTSIERKESSFRLKALQQPALIFDTYSYIHILADPDGGVNGGEYGEGLNSDFEFSLDTLAGDSILLTGRFKGSRLVLKRATQQDEQSWVNGDLKASMMFEYLGEHILNYFKRLVVGTQQYEISVDELARTVRFTWRDGNGAVQTHTSPYYFTSEGVALKTPLTDGGTTINFISGITWNAAAAAFQASVNGTAAATIRGAAAPVNVDIQAPARWWQTMAAQASYWVSATGFHVDGVDDAYGLRELPNFAFLVFWPEYFTGADLAGFVFAESTGLAIRFGPALEPVFTTSGKLIFNYGGDAGTITPDVEAAYVNTTLKFIDADGFYLVQTSPTTYDMVSADDAKTWITWSE